MRVNDDRIFIWASRNNILDWLDVLNDVLQVDLWQPNSASMIQENSTVDVHVGRNKTQWLRRHLHQAHIQSEWVSSSSFGTHIRVNSSLILLREKYQFLRDTHLSYLLGFVWLWFACAEGSRNESLTQSSLSTARSINHPDQQQQWGLSHAPQPEALSLSFLSPGRPFVLYLLSFSWLSIFTRRSDTSEDCG